MTNVKELRTAKQSSRVVEREVGRTTFIMSPLEDKGK